MASYKARHVFITCSTYLEFALAKLLGLLSEVLRRDQLCQVAVLHFENHQVCNMTGLKQGEVFCNTRDYRTQRHSLDLHLKLQAQLFISV